jgi:hypothetical protein
MQYNYYLADVEGAAVFVSCSSDRLTSREGSEILAGVDIVDSAPFRKPETNLAVLLTRNPKSQSAQQKKF